MLGAAGLWLQCTHALASLYLCAQSDGLGGMEVTGIARESLCMDAGELCSSCFAASG